MMRAYTLENTPRGFIGSGTEDDPSRGLQDRPGEADRQADAYEIIEYLDANEPGWDDGGWNDLDVNDFIDHNEDDDAAVLKEAHRIQRLAEKYSSEQLDVQLALTGETIRLAEIP
ncbi:hypothetical protein [Pseudonocardia spinosispora]|uniref:hypothetical protein n=1 Tax=Pseudonocardia spinosispora TaxID=103441 RepID=UPI0003F7FE87|nr:hypothetical protein [Pseudonocardia spinosispora]